MLCMIDITEQIALYNVGPSLVWTRQLTSPSNFAVAVTALLQQPRFRVYLAK
jgi:hypothetical protein